MFNHLKIIINEIQIKQNIELNMIAIIKKVKLIY